MQWHTHKMSSFIICLKVIRNLASEKQWKYFQCFHSLWKNFNSLLSYWIFFCACQYLSFNQFRSEKKMLVSLLSNHLCHNRYKIDDMSQSPQAFLQHQLFIYRATLQNVGVNSIERQDKVLALRMFTFCLGKWDMQMKIVKWYHKAMWE